MRSFRTALIWEIYGIIRQFVDHTRGYKAETTIKLQGRSSTGCQDRRARFERKEMSPPTGPMMPLWLAFFILFLTIVPGGGYVLMKIWFYFLNSRFRERSDAIREKLTKQAILSEEKQRAIFVGFFHPYWYA